MNASKAPLYIGSALILGGVLFLIANLGFADVSQAGFGVLLVVGGALFLAGYASRPRRWGLLFPAVALITIGAGTAISGLLPGVRDTWTGPLLLGGLGVPFLVGYAETRAWGLIIPAGVMLSLAATTIAGEINGGPISGAVLFAGLAITFAVLPAAAPARQTARWAYIVAIACAGLALIVLTTSVASAGLLWAVLLIVIGVALLFSTGRRRPVA